VTENADNRPRYDMTPFLWPRSVAVIGAASDPHILRGRLMQVMGLHDYDGAVYPVSRSETEIFGHRAYPTIADVPGPVDLALVVIPAAFVTSVLDDCGRAGVKAVQIITSGFAEEVGGSGVEKQAEIKAIADRYQMVVCGPNSEGFMNTRARLAPTFSPAAEVTDAPLWPESTKAGAVAVVAQSGGIGFSFYDRARARQLPFSFVVTTGNEACIDVVDVVEWMLDDAETAVFILFVETIKDGDRFRAVAARALDLGKPLIVVKIGQSDAGIRAALSHTAALAGAYGGYQAVFARYGIIEARDIEEAIDLATGFAYWRDRRPSGANVAIFTASGGAGGWLADATEAAGLSVPELDAATRAEIDSHLPAYGTSQNPVDATAQTVGRLGYARLVSILAEAPNIDAVFAIASARTPTRLQNDKDALSAVRAATNKPVGFWSYTQPHAESVQILAETGHPLFVNPRNCAKALRAFLDYSARRAAALPATATARPPAALADRGPVLCEYEMKPLLVPYGVSVAEEHLATTAAEAVGAFQSIGEPVVLKVQSPDLLHKSDHGLLALGVSDAAGVAGHFNSLMARARQAAPKADIRGVLVQPMARPGVEMILGISRDATFGPLITIGTGGIYTEILNDRATAPLPLDAVEARRLIEGLKTWPILAGARGKRSADVDALTQLMVALAAFAGDHADFIEELDLNPVIVHESGVSLVDGLLVQR
jgi:acyl-CoA synthetase (NDP forming)